MAVVIGFQIYQITRSPMALEDTRMHGFRKGFAALADLIGQAQKAGQVRKGLDPVVAAVCLLGSLETILTGIVLKAIDGSQENLEKMRKQVSELFLRGMQA